ncbi:MAG: CRISPR-associated endonuclease Cas2 [Amphiplicatus sp.]
MSARYSALSGYRIMWVWALFDLPVLTKPERKRATRFRKDLLDLGFEMVQFSVYARYCASKERADVVAADVGRLVPEGGKVDVLFFTDKQYELIKSYRGRSARTRPGKPEQFTLF